MIMEMENEVRLSELDELFETVVRVSVEVTENGKKRRRVEMVRLPRGAMKEIAQATGCAQKTVYNALRRGLSGDKADRVKRYVLEKYGKEVGV